MCGEWRSVGRVWESVWGEWESVLACGERMWGGDVGKCVEVWGPNTLLIPHISLPSPFPTSPLTSPTPHHTFLHLLSYLLPHLPPHPNTFSYYPHISLHLLKVWQSYHVTKFLWQSYHVAKLLATVSRLLEHWLGFHYQNAVALDCLFVSLHDIVVMLV